MPTTDMSRRSLCLLRTTSRLDFHRDEWDVLVISHSFASLVFRYCTIFDWANLDFLEQCFDRHCCLALPSGALVIPFHSVHHSLLYDLASLLFPSTTGRSRAFGTRK
jgi:hypothetical protein